MLSSILFSWEETNATCLFEIICLKWLSEFVADTLAFVYPFSFLRSNTAIETMAMWSQNTYTVCESMKSSMNQIQNHRYFCRVSSFPIMMHIAFPTYQRCQDGMLSSRILRFLAP